MRTTVLSLVFCAVVSAAAPSTPLTALADLASNFSQGDPASAIGMFDPQMQGYGQISSNIQALAAQTEVTCAIDVIDDTDADGVHKLDLDWIMNLKSTGDTITVERRRERVQVEMRQIKGKWKITAMTPLTILDPIHI
jgi:hypothetical protein